MTERESVLLACPRVDSVHPESSDVGVLYTGLQYVLANGELRLVQQSTLKVVLVKELASLSTALGETSEANVPRQRWHVGSCRHDIGSHLVVGIDDGLNGLLITGEIRSDSSVWRHATGVGERGALHYPSSQEGALLSTADFSVLVDSVN